MLTSNPIADVPAFISPMAMQVYVIVMAILVVGGVLLDVIHKQSAKYFFENAKKAEAMRKRDVSAGEKMGLAVATVASEVLTSSEFCNPIRRMSHLLTMYGFVVFIVSTVALVFAYPTGGGPAIWSMLWHLGALSLAVGGYWFWFFIRVDVAAEGKKWYQVSLRGDLFILSLLATSTFALIWSFLASSGGGVGAIVFFWLFVLAVTTLFSTVLWSKFAHMFFKPAAAFQKRVTKADGSRENLPAKYDLSDPAVHEKFPDIPMYMGKNPPNMGLGIKREAPRHY
ncbi:MAG: adenylyl-sulfate reductase [Gammaproteobacteria bacterium]|jgi:hypothetical protein